MKTFLFLAALLVLVPMSGRAGEPAASASPGETPNPATPLHVSKEPPDIPAIRLEKDGTPRKDFLARHEMFLQRGKEGPIGVLFLGDSITAGWAMAPEIWEKNFGPYQPANFGIGGDATQNVLWRIEHGELDGISPKVVVLMIGTNNGGNPRLVDGVRKVVAAIQAKLPRTRILLLGILPRGFSPTDPPWNGKARERTAGVNRELATLADGHRIRFLDMGPKFMDASGAIAQEIMPDQVHPGKPGYQIWADAMKPVLDEMMKEP